MGFKPLGEGRIRSELPFGNHSARVGGLTGQLNVGGRNLNLDSLPEVTNNNRNVVPVNYHSMVVESHTDTPVLKRAEIKQDPDFTDLHPDAQEVFRNSRKTLNMDGRGQRMERNAAATRAQQLFDAVNAGNMVISRPHNMLVGHKPTSTGYGDETHRRQLFGVDIDALNGKKGDAARDKARQQEYLNLELMERGVLFAVPVKKD